MRLDAASAARSLVLQARLNVGSSYRGLSAAPATVHMGNMCDGRSCETSKRRCRAAGVNDRMQADGVIVAERAVSRCATRRSFRTSTGKGKLKKANQGLFEADRMQHGWLEMACRPNGRTRLWCRVWQRSLGVEVTCL